MPFASESIVITGVGMVSTLGLGVVGSCAAARAGASRGSALADMFLGAPGNALRGHAVDPFCRGFTGMGRLVRLGVRALADLVSYANLPEDGRTGIVVNTSSGYHVTARENAEHDELDRVEGKRGVREPYAMQLRQAHYTEGLIPRICELAGVAIDARARTLLFEDQTPMAEAFRTATSWLEQRTVDRCVVGGIDSTLEPWCLEAFEHYHLLRTDEHAVGFMPGEAAAFLLVERADVAQKRRARIEAVLHEPERDNEKAARLEGAPATGAALARVIERALGKLPDGGRGVGLTLAGLNGDEHRATDWGGALVLLNKGHPGLGDRVWYPAESFGETGGAAPFVASCMAARALARGYADTNEILVWNIADTGAREACCLASPQS